MVLLAIAAVALLTGGAFAYWTSTSTTTATTVLPDTQPISFSPGVPTAELSPGSNAGVAIVAHNPNSFFIHISAMVLDDDEGSEPFAVDTPHAACGISALIFTRQDNGGSGWDVPAKVGSTDGVLALDMSSAITMGDDAADACQGAAFTVHLAAAN